MIGYPKWFSKIFISVSIFLLFLSGILLIPNMLSHRFEIDVPFELSGNIRLATTAIHVFVMCLALFILGGISVLHAKIGLKKNQNVTTGVILYSFFFLLTISGIGILYASNSDLISTSSVIHLIAGLLLFLIYIVHQKFR